MNSDGASDSGAMMTVMSTPSRMNSPTASTDTRVGGSRVTDFDLARCRASGFCLAATPVPGVCASIRTTDAAFGSRGAVCAQCVHTCMRCACVLGTISQHAAQRCDGFNWRGVETCSRVPASTASTAFCTRACYAPCPVRPTESRDSVPPFVSPSERVCPACRRPNGACCELAILPGRARRTICLAAKRITCTGWWTSIRR
jgi:hypothetical protein